MKIREVLFTALVNSDTLRAPDTWWYRVLTCRYYSITGSGASTLTFNATSIQNAVILGFLVLVLGALILPLFGINLLEFDQVATSQLKLTEANWSKLKLTKANCTSPCYRQPPPAQTAQRTGRRTTTSPRGRGRGWRTWWARSWAPSTRGSRGTARRRRKRSSSTRTAEEEESHIERI